MQAFIQKFLPLGYKTATAATIIQQNVPPIGVGYRSVLLRAVYTAAATAHTLSMLYPATSAGGHAPAAATLLGSKNTASAAAAAAQAVVNVTNTPLDPAGNAAAANDVVAYQVADGTWEFNTIASVATKAITLTTNLAKAMLILGKFRILGILADGYNMQLPCGANATTEWEDENGVLMHPDMNEPCVIQGSNGTNAGFLLQANIAYIDR